MNGIPAPEYGKNDQETMRNLMDSVAKMRKELNFLLHHLDDENIPTLPIAKADIKANRTSIEENEESIRLLAIDVAGNTAIITIQAGQIQSLVSDVAGNTSSITQLSNQITLKVDASGIISAINLSPEGVSISGNRINLMGAVTVLSDISGNLGHITAGNIDISDDVKIGDKLIIAGTNFNSGIEWSESDASIYYDPGSQALHIHAPNGVFANNVRLDV